MLILLTNMCPPEWRNGRRAALKMQYRKVCGFESHLGHNWLRSLDSQGIGAFFVLTIANIYAHSFVFLRFGLIGQKMRTGQWAKAGEIGVLHYHFYPLSPWLGGPILTTRS